jgi:hypothetical protein
MKRPSPTTWPLNFSPRWTRDEWFEIGTDRFSYRSNDGIRL